MAEERGGGRGQREFEDISGGSEEKDGGRNLGHIVVTTSGDLSLVSYENPDP